VGTLRGELIVHAKRPVGWRAHAHGGLLPLGRRHGLGGEVRCGHHVRGWLLSHHGRIATMLRQLLRRLPEGLGLLLRLLLLVEVREHARRRGLGEWMLLVVCWLGLPLRGGGGWGLWLFLRRKCRRILRAPWTHCRCDTMAAILNGGGAMGHGFVGT
jgi:hypothetical protein